MARRGSRAVCRAERRSGGHALLPRDDDARRERRDGRLGERADRVVEIGWRLARGHWGNGYASEAAREALRFGFEELGLEEIVAFTATTNMPSRGVMERIGMTHQPSRDFDHPNVPDGPLKRHVLYSIRS